MQNRSAYLLTALTVLMMAPLCGCSDSPKSVTDGVEQSAIDAYKANEAALAAESSGEMK